ERESRRGGKKGQKRGDPTLEKKKDRSANNAAAQPHPEPRMSQNRSERQQQALRQGKRARICGQTQNDGTFKGVRQRQVTYRCWSSAGRRCDERLVGIATATVRGV